jgi:hypothetical protein
MFTNALKEGSGLYHGSYQISLQGLPWNGQAEDAVDSRILIGALLGNLSYHGWDLIRAIDLSSGMGRGIGDKDSLFFLLADGK